MTGLDRFIRMSPSSRAWYSLCTELWRSEISAQMGQLFSSLPRKGHTLASAFSMMAEYTPTPSRETVMGWGATASQKWRRKEKVILELLTRQTLVQLRRAGEERVFWCLVLRQGGLSQRCESLRLRKRCVLFCPHFATGSQVLSLCTSSACSCFSLIISSSTTSASTASYCESYSSTIDRARPTFPFARLLRRQCAMLASEFTISRASMISRCSPWSRAQALAVLASMSTMTVAIWRLF